MLLQKYTEHSMDGANHRSPKENVNRKSAYTQNKEKAAEIPWTNNEVDELGKLNPNGVYLGQER